MILLICIFLYLGRKRGMDYKAWIMAYLVASLVDLIFNMFFGKTPLPYISFSLCSIIIILFFIWPYIAGEDQKKDMKIKAQKYKDEEDKMNNEIYDRREEWPVLTTYVDSTDFLKFKKDKELLGKSGIDSIAKSFLGITSLSVHQTRFEEAGRLIGNEAIQPE